MSPSDQCISVHVSTRARSPRVEYGVQRIMRAMRDVGLDAQLVDSPPGAPGRHLYVGVKDHSAPEHAIDLPPQGYALSIGPQRVIELLGGDQSGALYACLELAGRIRAWNGVIPDQLPPFVDAPQFTLRGPAIGLQKTFILPGRKVYEYPVTPELFRFFYDRDYWQQWLDFLVDCRFNTLFIWSGHPFSSLVRVDGYPEALEVPIELLERNAAMYRWIADECDRRGIWLVQSFYSILLPPALARKHGLETQLASIHPLAADYTRKSIAQFVKAFPNVGLMPCLGEALQKLDEQVEWCCETILPGVHDGMKLAGLTTEPPIVLRTHATDARVVMPAALKVYRNLYTEAKYNGESLTTSEPRGVRQKLHQAMSALGSTHLINVHILANLEPFRYGAQRFIKQCMVAARDRLGAGGLHLYPLFFWNWPDAPDKVDPPLKQWERDWIWFEAWARYAWNPDVDEETDRAYWIDELTERFGSRDAASHILDACNAAGEVAPRLLRRFGITEGNRQTLSLGMTLDQLVNPDRYRPFPELWESQAPPGERLGEYVEREWSGQAHEGETPPQIAREALAFAAAAQASLDAARPFVNRDRDEFERIANDVAAIGAMARNYAEKASAAMLVLRYRFSTDINDMRRAADHLAESLEHYRALVRLTEHAYHCANSMQTNQRKIPVSGGIDGKPVSYHWSQLLGLYETELVEFRKKVSAIESGRGDDDESSIQPLARATFRVLSLGIERFEIGVGAGVFTDRKWVIESLAPELVNLMSMRFSHAAAADGRYDPIEFECDGPVRVLVGYVKGEPPTWRRPPDLETDAYADDRGGAQPILTHAAAVTTLPAIDVHGFLFAAGRNRLDLRGSGSFVILGVVPADVEIRPRDAGRGGGSGT